MYLNRFGHGIAVGGDEPLATFRVEWDGHQWVGDPPVIHDPLPDDKTKWHTAAARVAHGIAGYAKAAIGIDPAEDDVIAARRLACLGDGTPGTQCEHATECSTAWCPGGLCCGKIFSGDKTCGCCISKKAAIAGERCPIGKW